MTGRINRLLGSFNQLNAREVALSLKARAQELKLLMDHAEQSVNVIAYGEMTD